MCSQRDDVQKGIDDATAALEQLKGEMQKQFDEGFDRINENFKKLFRELFGGGRAELQMTTPNATTRSPRAWRSWRARPAKS